MKVESGSSMYDTFLPQALERELGESFAPKVRFIARNSALTGMVALALIVVEVVTLPAVAGLISWHVAIGMVITTLVAAKLIGVLVRFVRFYQGDAAYVAAGPPWAPLRLLAVPLSLATLALLGSGIELTVAGPSSFSTSFLVPAHTLIAIFWVFLVGLHVFAYFRRSARSSLDDAKATAGLRSAGVDSRGSSRIRMGIVAIAVVGGLALSWGLRSYTSEWSTAFLGGTKASQPASSLIPTRKNQYPQHDLVLEKQRVKTHLNDVKALHVPKP